ncbi:hypothetical protein HYE60_08930 [Aggregatibacter actinomycetemcomitans]|nr:hypothetical protein [Aggregatibacter actinomycetemcomitans]
MKKHLTLGLGDSIYRLLHEGKPLPAWHPLISGDPNSVKKADILIKYGIHERDVIDWFDFILD